MAKSRNPEVQAYADAQGISYTRAYDRLWHRKVGFRDADRVAALAAKLDAIEPMEWARLAAFVDGEGSVCIMRRGKHAYVALQISNTDARLVLWLQSLFGGGIASIRPATSRCKASFIWSVRSRHAEFVMRRMRPYMILKGQQVDIGLALRETVKLGRNQENALTTADFKRRDDLVSQMRVLNRRGPADGE